MKISKEAKKANVDYMCGQIKHICTTFGDRDPGSEGERKAQEYLADELKKYTDDVKIESFKLNPGSFFGWIYISVFACFLSFILYWIYPIASIVVMVLGIIPMFSQFIFYSKLMDKFYKEKESSNVFATRKCTGEVKRRVVLCGHTDATWEWGLNYKFGHKGFEAGIIMCFIGIVFMIGINIVRLIVAGVGFSTDYSTLEIVMGACFIIFVPFLIAMFWFSNSKRVVPGANDNLSASLLSVSVLKAMEDAGIRYENTEVCALMLGSEEAGLRGSKAFAKAHYDEYNKNNPIETIFLNFETLREIEHITIYARDMNALTKTDPGICALYKEAGKRIGMDLKYGATTIGATDSAAFTQNNMKSACLGALDHKLRDYYHTRRDNWDNLSEECLSICYDIALNSVDIYNEKGLPDVK